MANSEKEFYQLVDGLFNSTPDTETDNVKQLLLDALKYDVWRHRSDIQFLLGIADQDLSVGLKGYIDLTREVTHRYGYFPNFVTTTSSKQLYHDNLGKRFVGRFKDLVDGEQRGLRRPIFFDSYSNVKDDVQWLAEFTILYAKNKISLANFAYGSGLMYLCSPILPSNIARSLVTGRVEYYYVNQQVESVRFVEYPTFFRTSLISNFWPEQCKNPIRQMFEEQYSINEKIKKSYPMGSK